MSGTRDDAIIKLSLDDSDVPAPAKRVEAALTGIARTGEISARQTAAAMRTLPAQFTDIATQLAGGQSLGLVLMQQGGQIKDSFGGVGPALQAISAAITPARIAIGGSALAVGALAMAAKQGADDTKELRDQLALTGNAAGLTGARLIASAELVSQATQQTVGGARDILMQLASSGQVSRGALNDMAVAVGRVADVTGTDAKKIAQDFAGMAGGVAKWAAEHNKAWNFISVEQYRYIRRLEEQGKAEEAARYVSRQVTEHLKDQATQLGYLEGAYNVAAKAVSSFWASMKAVGREKTVVEQIEEVERKLSELPLAGTGKRQATIAAERQQLVERLRLLQQAAAYEERSAALQSERAAAERAGIRDEQAAEGRRPAKADPPVDFAVLDRWDARVRASARAAAEDQAGLGGFIERQNEAQRDRDNRRIEQNDRFLEEYYDANQRASIALIADQSARAEAQIRLDEAMAQRRIAALKAFAAELDKTNPESGASVRMQAAELERLSTERAAAARTRAALDARVDAVRQAEETGRANYQSVRESLAAAFRDTKDPIRAFGEALASTIFSRATASLADALATALVGANGQGGYLAGLLGFGGAGNGPSGSDLAGLNEAPVGFARGISYVPRNMLAMIHEGEAVVRKSDNPAAGGGGARGIHQTNHYHIDARADREALLADMVAISRQSNAALVEDLAARRII